MESISNLKVLSWEEQEKEGTSMWKLPFSHLNCMANSLDDTIKNTSTLNFKRSPVQEAFVYDTGSNWSVPSKAKMLCNTSDK